MQKSLWWPICGHQSSKQYSLHITKVLYTVYWLPIPFQITLCYWSWPMSTSVDRVQAIPDTVSISCHDKCDYQALWSHECQENNVQAHSQWLAYNDHATPFYQTSDWHVILLPSECFPPCHSVLYACNTFAKLICKASTIAFNYLLKTHFFQDA